MTDRPSTAVPVTSAAYDPRNPDALGYDPASPDLEAVAAAAGGDPDLTLALAARLRRETARFRAWRDEYRRHGAGGVGFSGGSVGPFVPAAPGALLEDARAAAHAAAGRRERGAEFWRFTREMLTAPVFPGAPSASLEEV